LHFGIIGGGFGIYGWLSALNYFNEIQLSTLAKYKNNIYGRNDLYNSSNALRSVNFLENELQLIKKVDTLIIARRPIDQIKLIKFLIKNSWSGNLIIEKPIAPSPDEAIDILQKLKKLNINLQVGFSINETQWSKQVEEIILSKKPNKILVEWDFNAHHYKHFKNTWKSNPVSGGGALNFYSIHLIAWLASFAEWQVNYCSPKQNDHEDPKVDFEVENEYTKIQLKCNTNNLSKELFSIKEISNFDKDLLKLDNPLIEANKLIKLPKVDYRVPYLIKILEKALVDDWLDYAFLENHTKLWSEIIKLREV